MRPYNETLRAAKLQVAIEQLNTLDQRIANQKAKLVQLEEQFNKKVSQVEALGGIVASSFEDIQPSSISTDTNTANEA